MEKTLTFVKINGEEEAVRFKCTAMTPLKYQAFFKRSFLSDLLKLTNNNVKNADKPDEQDLTHLLDNIDLEVVYKIAYILAKTADNSIPEFDKWIEQYQSIDVLDILTELLPEAIYTVIPEKKTMMK